MISDSSKKKMVLKMFKETDWRKMHIFRLQAAVGKGLVSQALKQKEAWDGANLINSRIHRTFVPVDGIRTSGLHGSRFLFLIYPILIMTLVMRVNHYNSLDTQF